MKTKSYTWDASDYASFSTGQFQWAQELLDKLALKGFEALLDIGCGDGKVTAMVARQLPDGYVVGIDKSEDMIVYAQQQYTEPQYPNLTFRKMDATALSFEHKFDVVFSNATLHWVEDHRSVLEGVKRNLKKSGKLLFQMGGRGNAAELIKVVETTISRQKWRGYFRNFAFPYFFYSPKEYQNWLEAFGLRTDRLELIPKDMQHQGKEGLAGWIRTTWLPYVERVPTGLMDEFISEIVEAYLEAHPPDEDGTVHVKMVRLEVEAKSVGA